MSSIFPENPKILLLEEAVARRETLASKGESLALTNGCFDLMHAGHLYFLAEAAKQADELWVAVNGDLSVKALKGPSRPIQTQQERAYALANLESVSRVFIFDTERLTEQIRALRPEVYVKAGDYNPDTQNQEERQALLEANAEIRFLPFLEGFSTTNVVAKIRSLGA